MCHHISTGLYRHFARSDPVSDDSLRGCRTFQRMCGWKTGFCVHIWQERKKKFLFFFLVFIAVFVERTTFSFFFFNNYVSLFLFSDWPGKQGVTFALFSLFEIVPRSSQFIFPGCPPPVLQSVDLRNSSNATCYPVLTCVSLNTLKPFTHNTSESQ